MELNTDEIQEETETQNVVSNIYVIFKCDHTIYAINADYVTEMVQISNITPEIDSPDYVLGVTNLRGKIIPIVDLRMRFGINTMVQNMMNMLDEYEQAHLNWLKELESCIDENRNFKLARDPHKCKFGVWYDKYRAEDMIIANFMKKFDAPHKVIHSIADKALDLEKEGKLDEAKQVINHTRNTSLADMLKLFSGLKELIQERVKTLVIILTVDGKTFGINVDNINFVHQITPEMKEPVNDYLSSNVNEKFIDEVAKISVDNKEMIVMLLDPVVLYKLQ